MVRSVQGKCPLDIAVIERDIETAAGSNDQLRKFLVGVPASGFSARDIVQVLGAPNIERNGYSVFHDGNVSFGVVVFVQMDDGAVIDRVALHGGKF